MPERDYNFDFLNRPPVQPPHTAQEHLAAHPPASHEVNPERTAHVPQTGIGAEIDFDSLHAGQQAAERGNRDGRGAPWKASGDLDSDEVFTVGETREAEAGTAPSAAEPEPGPVAPTPETEPEPLEAPQDTPEVDPRTVPMFAGGWGTDLLPSHKGGYGIIYYDPEPAANYLQRTEYSAGHVAEEGRITGQVRHLLMSRDFARTGEVAPKDALNDSRGEGKFYDEVLARMGIAEKRGLNVGTTLVRVDGYSVLALGIDTKGDDRGSLAFAAKGNLSQNEIIRRARTVFPEIFEKVDRIGLSEEPRQIIDLPPTPPQ